MDNHVLVELERKYIRSSETFLNDLAEINGDFIFFKKIITTISLLFIAYISYAQLTDHGTVAPVSEGRGLIAHRTSTGKPIIITVASDIYKGNKRGSLLVVDAKTGKTDQYWYPQDGLGDKNSVAGDTFAFMLASNGRFFYTMFGDVFLEFDLDKREWTFSRKIEGMVMSFAEGPDGKIFFANYPRSTLYSFDPQDRDLRYYGQLDDVEKYPFSLAVDNSEWVYAGIGTAKNNIVAYNIASGEHRNLIPEGVREKGDGHVFLGVDGVIYATHLKDQKAPLFRLENGQKIEVIPAPAALPAKAVTGFVYWQYRYRINDFPRGGKVERFFLHQKSGRVVDETGTVHDITFDYKTNGANITSLTLGPDGAIWGSTAHPIHLWRFDPTKVHIGDWKGINQAPGGNFPNLVTADKKIYGALYNGGKVWRFDTSKPIDKSTNPSLLGMFKEIARPRAAVKTLDGKSIIFGGYPGYGVVGGDLVFVNTVDEEATAVKVQDQIPGLSTIAMRSLPGGLLVGGTSTAAPGGGSPTATEAVLYLMDENSRKIIFQMVPVASGKDIMSLEARNGTVYGITADAQLFVFDLESRKVISQMDISEYGSPTRPGQSLILADDGNIYGVMSKSIFKVGSNSVITKLIDLPEAATAGIAFDQRKNIVYFACGSRLWSYRIE